MTVKRISGALLRETMGGVGLEKMSGGNADKLCIMLDRAFE